MGSKARLPRRRKETFQNLHASRHAPSSHQRGRGRTAQLTVHRQIIRDGNSALTQVIREGKGGQLSSRHASSSHQRWRGRPAQLMECIVKSSAMPREASSAHGMHRQVTSEDKGGQLSSQCITSNGNSAPHSASSNHQRGQGRPAQLMECIVHGASSSRRRGRGRPAQLREGRLK